MNSCIVISLVVLVGAILATVMYFLKTVSFKKSTKEQFKESSEALDKEISGMAERHERRKKDIWANWIDKPTGV